MPEYHYEPDLLTVSLTSMQEPKNTEHVTWLYLPAARGEINGDPAVMPNHITGISTIDKTSRIQGIIVEKRICRMDGFFQVGILLRASDLTGQEVHMTTRARSEAFLI